MPKKKLQPEQSDTLTRVVNDFNSAWSYTSSTHHSLWLDCWKLYNNQRTDRSYEGITNTFVPMTFSTIETMVAALAGSRPRFDFQPTNPEQETDTKVLNFLLDHYWDKDKWQSKVDKWIRSMLMYGTGVMFAFWDIDKPCLYNVPLRDFFVDPTASSPEDARYMGRRYLTTLEALKDYEYFDSEKQEMVKVYKNLDKIRDGSGNTGEETDKEKKDVFMGSTLGKEANKRQIECIEYWTEDQVIVVANRTIIIREDENPHLIAARSRGDENPKGLLPFIIQRDYVDESLFYGKGEIEPIIPAQELLNDMTNQNIDAVTYSLNPMWTLDPKYSDQKEKVESLPGAVYPFEAGALNPIPMQAIPQSAFNERLNIKSEIRETTASDQVVKGVGEDNSNTTATEIRAQVAQAGARFAVKVSQIENEGYYDLAKIVLDLVQLYVTEPMMVQIVGEKSGIDWAMYDPGIYAGDYDCKVKLESQVEADKQQEADQAKELFLAFNGDPLINQGELRRLTLQKSFELDEDELDTLLTPEPMTDPMMGGIDPMSGAPIDPMAAPVDPMLDPAMAGVPTDVGALY